MQGLQAYLSQKINLRLRHHSGAGLPSNEGAITMQLTTEENERAAYAAGNTALATAWGRIIDLEQERLLLRQCIRDAADMIDDDLEWVDRAAKLLDSDE